MFQDVSIWDAWHDLDHYMVLGCLGEGVEKDLTYYLRKSHRFPLRSIYRNLEYTSDQLFSELKTQIPNPPLHYQVRRA